MNDPERFLRGSAGGLATRLLRAGVTEEPSARSLERTLVALGAAATTLGTASAAGALGAVSASKVATTLTLLGLVKWAGVGIASGVVVSLAAHAVRTEPAPARVTEAGPRLETPAIPAVIEAAPAAPVLAAPTTSATAPRHVTAPPVTSTPVEPGAPLAAEVTFVDRGRAAFQRGDASGALAALDRYERDFPERRLLPEVLYLRMEARAALGDRTQAVTLARLILRDFGQSPHAARARALLSAP